MWFSFPGYIMTAKREKRKGGTVGRILEAAKDVFAEKGFDGARVDEIARKAGVNKAALYYHIGDKSALYAEAIHDVIGGAVQRLGEGIRDAKTPEDKIRTYLRTLAATFDQNPQIPRMMMRELASGGHNIPEVFFQDLFSIFRTLSGIIREGTDRGVFEDTLPYIVHFMAIGATVVCKSITPVLQRIEQLPGEMADLHGDVSGIAGREIEKLILKALKK
ncbi:TetR/AcrR family transcriptional regulator [bacterium]|nr:TetR/AcrR family transcriptional regulator [bacterium]